jgi:hypothetical protein
MTRTKKRRKRAEGKHRLPSAGTFSNGREFGEPADWWSFIHQGADHLAELSISHVLYSPVIGALGVATCRLRWGGALRAR